MRFPRRDSVVPGPVYALAFVNVCIGLGYGVVAPVIPVFARDFGVSDLAASSVVSIYAFTRVLASFGASRILLRFDERTVLTVGLLLAAASSLAAAFAPTFLALLVLRAVGGIGTAIPPTARSTNSSSGTAQRRVEDAPRRCSSRVS